MDINQSQKTDLPPEQDIRKASASDLEDVSHILASAFSEDPVFTWMSGHKEIYHYFFRYELEALYKHHDLVYINKNQTGAAVWLPTGLSAKPPVHWRFLSLVWAMARSGGYRSLRRGDQISRIMEAKHPGGSHFYLHAIGAKMGHQGKGIGSSLLKTGLSVCDEQGVPAYLESSNEKNNPLYERYGFEIIEEVKLPDSGPSLWLMERAARK